MSRVPIDASVNKSPMTTDGPTKMNGPLADKPQTLNDRLIAADFASAVHAQAARASLLEAGIGADCIELMAAAGNPEHRSQARPADEALIGQTRQALLPDEVSTAARSAIAASATVLNVRPDRSQVEIVVQVLDASHPLRFDADLERWRNKG